VIGYPECETKENATTVRDDYVDDYEELSQYRPDIPEEMPKYGGVQPPQSPGLDLRTTVNSREAKSQFRRPITQSLNQREPIVSGVREITQKSRRPINQKREMPQKSLKARRPKTQFGSKPVIQTQSVSEEKSIEESRSGSLRRFQTAPHQAALVSHFQK